MLMIDPFILSLGIKLNAESERILKILVKQIPRTMYPYLGDYLKARSTDLIGLVLQSGAMNQVISLGVDHLATRSIVLNKTDFDQFRNKEHKLLSEDGYRMAQEIPFNHEKHTFIYAPEGQGRLSGEAYQQALDATDQGQPSLQCGIFSTCYVLDLCLTPVSNDSFRIIRDFVQENLVLDAHQKWTVLKDPNVPEDVKSILINHANQGVNHLALATRSLEKGATLLQQYSQQNVLNERQSAAVLDQISTIDARNDYIELVERNPQENGDIILDQFKVQNTVPLFRSTVYGVIKTYIELAKELGNQSVNEPDIRQILPGKNAQDAINYFAQNGLLDPLLG